MLSKTIFTIALATFGATSVIGAAVPSPEPDTSIDARNVLTATNAFAACNCPNNCSHKQGSSCKYYGGVSDDSTVVKGHCNNVGGSLTCQ